MGDVPPDRTTFRDLMVINLLACDFEKQAAGVELPLVDHTIVAGGLHNPSVDNSDTSAFIWSHVEF